MPNIKVSALFLILSILMVINSFWESATRFLRYVCEYEIAPKSNDYVSEEFNAEITNVKKLVIIGIMSAQDHFKERESIRNTWGELILNNSIDYKFLIGKQICHIPPEDRVIPYSCEQWNVTLPPSVNLSVLNINNSSVTSVGYSGFSFIVKQTISVSKLGVNTEVFKNTSAQIFRIILVDAASGVRLASASFIEQGYVKQGFVWKTISSVDLPVDSEAILKIVTEEDIEVVCPINILNNGVIHVFEVIKYGKYLKFNEPVCSLVGFIYAIKDIESLKKNIVNASMRQNNWDQQTKALQYYLEIEKKAYGDILFVDIVDVYKNLSLKLFEFLKWTQTSSTSYEYVLKTDDDVFLDINRIVSTLMIHKHDDWDWWSCFRQGYPPPNYGKWRDRLFDGQHYPLFPSGAGYVLSNDVVSSLVSKNAVENSTAGEDVAVGIWMHSSLKRYPKKLNTTYAFWACGETCSTVRPCNVPQLTWQQMHQIMHRITQSTSICPP